MKIQKVAKTIKQINQYINAYELLFDKKPKVLIKGNLTTEYDIDYYSDYEREYVEVKKITTKYIYLNSGILDIDHIPYYLYENEYYHIILDC